MIAPECTDQAAQPSEPTASGYDAAAARLKLDAGVVQRVAALLDVGAAPPFIARYRRDETDALTEDQIVAIRDVVRDDRGLAERKQSILRSLEGQSKLSEELRTEIEQAETLHRLDDLYLPFKPIKQSPAAEARDQGLGPLADEILADATATKDLDARLADFVDEDKKVADAASALAGAGLILAEQFSEHAGVRGAVRRVVASSGMLVCRRIEGGGKKAEKKAEAFKGYFDFREELSKLPAHRVMAINRGERAGVLAVTIECDQDAAIKQAQELLVDPTHTHADFLLGCAADAVTRLVLPSLEEEARRNLNESAESHSLEVFARNLRQLLMAPPLPGKRVLGVDPGYKNGCQVAALDESGAVLATGVVAVVGSEEETKASRGQLAGLITEHRIDLIALGNGKACRPTEEFIASILADELKETETRYAIVNEAGASVYSTSTICREELPDLEPPARCAVSIGRRLQDPLAELVKIDPASVGVGLYQHDVRAKPMNDALEEVVSSCVCAVGVDLNTASAAVLRYVTGLNPLKARRLVEHRQEHGPYKERAKLREAASLADAAFEQAAGFLKITGGANPLDATWVHPESYDAASKLLEGLGVDAAELLTDAGAAKFREAAAASNRDELAAKLAVGPHKLAQLIEALSHPGRDPRTELPPPVFRRGVVKFEDLQPGAELRGTVLNVVDFGAFVDVGLSDSGLVHISRMSNGYVNSPHDLIAVGDAVKVWVASVDAEKRRVSLSMVEPGSQKPRQGRPPRRRGGAAQPTGQPAGDEATPADGASHSGSSSKRSRSTEGRKQGGRRDKGARGKGGRGGDRHSHKRPEQKRAYETRSKAPPKPITKEMETGAEAMRTFGDLLQFHQKKSQEQDDTSDADATPNGE